MAEGIRCNQLHPPSEEILKKEGQIHEVVESRHFELHQNIDVAGIFLFPSGKGDKETDPPDAESFLYSQKNLLIKLSFKQMFVNPGHKKVQDYKDNQLNPDE
jgi:hypothetical protein